MNDPTIERTFTPSNPSLTPDVVVWTKVPDTFPCKECRERGGWMPKIDQGDCPQCWGEDTYGEPSFCGQCEYCCGDDWAEVDAALDKIGVTIAEPPKDELLLARFYQNWMAVSLVTIEDEEAFAFARGYLRMVKESDR